MLNCIGMNKNANKWFLESQLVFSFRRPILVTFLHGISTGLVPLRLLPFRLLMVKLCHFAYSTEKQFLSTAMNTVLVITPIVSLNSSIFT